MVAVMVKKLRVEVVASAYVIYTYGDKIGKVMVIMALW